MAHQTLGFVRGWGWGSTCVVSNIEVKGVRLRNDILLAGRVNTRIQYLQKACIYIQLNQGSPEQKAKARRSNVRRHWHQHHQRVRFCKFAHFDYSRLDFPRPFAFSRLVLSCRFFVPVLSVCFSEFVPRSSKESLVGINMFEHGYGNLVCRVGARLREAMAGGTPGTKGKFRLSGPGASTIA